MAIFAISDLHLSFGVNKPMNIFGKTWENYEERIKKNWLSTVTQNDTVIIPGDISWGLTFNEALPDFKFIDKLPGQKILIRGNHDYYFSTKTKLSRQFKENNLNTLKILQNEAFDVDNYIICGTRGWGRNEGNTKEFDEKIIAREECRLILSLEQGRLLQKSGINKDILVALHYPPFVSNFQNIMKEYNVKKCIYGHLHGYGRFLIKEGIIDNIEYVMVSCDNTDFKLVKL